MQLITKIWGWGARIVAQLGGRTIVMLFAALLIAFGSLMFSDGWIVSVKKQIEQIIQAREKITVLNQLKADLLQAESAQRGYLITKRIAYIAPFNAALNQARANISLSEILVKNSPSKKNPLVELQLLREITANVAAKSAEMQLIVKLIDLNKIEEANQVLNLDIGHQQMQKLTIETNKLIQQQTADLNSMIKKRQNTVTLARISVTGGTLILIFLVVMVIKQLLNELVAKSHLQKLIEEDNINYEVKLKQQTKLLRSMALDCQADVERERQKLSRELHDEFGSIFTATKMDLAWCMKKLAQTAPDVVEKLAKTTKYVDQGIQYQRHIVQELHPSMVSTFGFWPALKALIKDAAERNRWQLKLNLPDETVSLNETISLITYRIVQESLNNANKHAKATVVSVDIMLDEHYIKTEISDNGVGVDKNNLNRSTHGLSGMRNRVLAIGGHFEMVSEPSKGMLIRALIPLNIS